MRKNLLFAALITLVASAVFVFGGSMWQKGDSSLSAQIPVSKWQRFAYYYKLTNVKEVRWAGHLFERAILETNEFLTTGNKGIKFTESGYMAPSYSLPRSKLLDVNMNEPVKVRIRGTLEGELRNFKQFNFSEFAIYLMDESGNAKGMRQLGSKHNARSPNMPTFKFTEFIVENTGKNIVITDSSGFSLSYTKDFKYVTNKGYTEENRGGNYGELNPKEKWFLVINCHVNGEGFCRLDIKDIKVTK